MNTITGTLLCALGGIAGATFALPFRCIKTRSYETYWFVYAVFGLVVFPLSLASMTCPNLFGLIGGADTSVLARCIGFGALWGLGGLTWGLMIRYLGIGLGLAIGCGLCSATGTLIPPIVTGHAGDLFKDTSAVVTFVSVLVSLVGIVFVGLAGKFKEGELDEAAKKRAVAEFDFKKGLVTALIAGVASAGINFGLQGAPELEKAALDALTAGKTLRTRLFDGAQTDALAAYLAEVRATRQPCVQANTWAGPLYPAPDGALPLLDGTVVRIAADATHLAGLPISDTLVSNGAKAVVEAEGLCAFRAEKGRTTAFAAGRLKRVSAPGLELVLDQPEDVVLRWIDGAWHGVWQTAGRDAPVPAALLRLTGHWTRLLMPPQGGK